MRVAVVAIIGSQYQHRHNRVVWFLIRKISSSNSREHHHRRYHNQEQRIPSITESCSIWLISKRRLTLLRLFWLFLVITCPAPDDPQNGEHVAARGYQYATSVSFTCNTNYTMSDGQSIVCREDKTWSGTPPYCSGMTANDNHPKPQSKMAAGLPAHGCSLNTPSVQANLLFDRLWSLFFSFGDSFTAPCRDPGIPKNTVRLHNDFRHDRHVRFRCKQQDYIMHGDSQIRCRDGDWDKRPPTCSCKSSGFLDLAKSLVCYLRHSSWTLWISLSLVGETYWKAFPAAIQCPSDHAQLWAFIEYWSKIWEKLISFGKNKICASIEASFGPLTSLFMNQILQSPVIVLAPNWFRGLVPMESRGHQEAQNISSLSNMSVGAATLSILWLSQSPWKKCQIHSACNVISCVNRRCRCIPLILGEYLALDWNQYIVPILSPNLQLLVSDSIGQETAGYERLTSGTERE